jgi:hypothetical protein
MAGATGMAGGAVGGNGYLNVASVTITLFDTAMVVMTCTFLHAFSAGSSGWSFAFYVDGGLGYSGATSNNEMAPAITYAPVLYGNPSGVQHTFLMQWAANSGSTSLVGGSMQVLGYQR